MLGAHTVIPTVQHLQRQPNRETLNCAIDNRPASRVNSPQRLEASRKPNSGCSWHLAGNRQGQGHSRRRGRGNRGPGPGPGLKPTTESDPAWPTAPLPNADLPGLPSPLGRDDLWSSTGRLTGCTKWSGPQGRRLRTLSTRSSTASSSFCLPVFFARGASVSTVGSQGQHLKITRRKVM